ncbi:hypothetical protein R5W23_001751 [Gemmata sp. JC673]|uniref:Right-handed parallel beta-helix repeat-containing protein n=1 Tax=Gemmata algarum TaxID=2975278 RepID=A0ABU5F3M7_9BACT|nr:hypothetical protein [Gemmata algarum]MDY3560516.1 hypothetical protein [Gemmata algarum]
MAVEALEGRDVPAVIFTDTYAWSYYGFAPGADVTVTVEDDAPGHPGRYLWTYTVTNTGYTQQTGDAIGGFAIPVGDPDDVADIGGGSGWSGAVGYIGYPTLLGWQGGAIAAGASADFTFTTSMTGVEELGPDMRFMGGTGGPGAAGVGPVAAPAPTLLVTTAQDVVDNFDGETSLREAIAVVNGKPNPAGSQRIKFKDTLNGATITLNPNAGFGQLTLSSGVFIDGENKGITVRRDASTTTLHRIFEVTSQVRARLNGLTVKNGKLDFNPGAAILSHGYLNVENCTFSQNEATGSRGGAIAAEAESLKVTGGGFTGNKAALGGAIYLGDGVNGSIYDTHLTLNIATDRGGGLYISASNVALSGVDVNGNSAATRGGGIYVGNPVAAGSILILTGGTTVQNNVVSSTTGKGGGIYFGKGTINLNGVWIGSNSATQGDGLYLVFNTTKNVGTSGVTFFDDSEFVEPA